MKKVISLILAVMLLLSCAALQQLFPPRKLQSSPDQQTIPHKCFAVYGVFLFFI